MNEPERTALLGQLSDALAATVEVASTSVVRVEARRRGHASGLAWSADGLVLAAHHTIQREHRLRVGLPDGETVAADLVGRDPGTDVALLRTGVHLTPPAWAEADTLAVGHLVLSVGRHDREAQASLGIVAQKRGPWRTGAGGRVEAFIQTDIGVYPGFSGSALVDARGRVAGMNTSWFGGRASLALPAATLRRVVEQLAAHGHVRRGYLGVTAQAVNLPEAAGQPTGLLVFEVEGGSPADRAGVLLGDVLLGIGEEAVQSHEDLLATLVEAAGETRTLRLWRGGQVVTLDVTVGER
jgi:S1-C subfamily serine protease